MYFSVLVCYIQKYLKPLETFINDYPEIKTFYFNDYPWLVARGKVGKLNQFTKTHLDPTFLFIKIASLKIKHKAHETNISGFRKPKKKTSTFIVKIPLIDRILGH